MSASQTRSGLTTATGRQCKIWSSLGKKIQDNKIAMGGRLTTSRAALLILKSYNHGRGKEDRAATGGLAEVA